MKRVKILGLSFISFLVFGITANAQVSISNLKNVEVSKLSDNDIEKLRAEIEKRNMQMTEVEAVATQNGMSATDFASLKARLEAVAPTTAIGDGDAVIEKGTQIKEQVIQMDEVKRSQVYGSEIFTTASLSFEPNSNMATPGSYILGVGDEMQIVITGMQEYAGTARVSKEGRIVIPHVGQVYVNGLTFDAAQTQIKKAASRIYPSLGSGQSQLSVTLSNIRTIRITIIGARKPGNYSVSSLSSVFNALHAAGGPNENGSYRKIELIRNNKVIRVIDIYKFLTKGDQSDNVNLQENDVIRIPVYDNRVKVEGHVKRPGVFELLEKETFTDLIEYCGGFDEAAYRKNIKLIQNTDNGIKIVDMTEDKYKNYIPQLGDVFKVGQLTSKFTNKVSVRGAVYRPDDYEFAEGMTVADLIAKADGLLQDAYVNRALLIREKEDLTKEITTLSITEVLNGEEGNIVLRKNDELVISSEFDFRGQHNLNIYGEVHNPGEYGYIKNISLYDLIQLAGGLNDKASRYVEVSSIISKDEKASGKTEMSEVRRFEIDTLFLDQSKNMELAPYDIVFIRKKPIFETQRTVVISGEFEFPGRYVISDRKQRILDIVQQAGGFKADADISSMRVYRQRGNRDIYIPVYYKKIKNNPKSRWNFMVQAGDELIIERLLGTVYIEGEIKMPDTEVPYHKKRLKYYVRSAGGFSDKAHKKHTYVVHRNRLGNSTKTFIGMRFYPKVYPGDKIYISKKPEDTGAKKGLSTMEVLAISSMLTSVTGMVIAIINVSKNN